MTMDEAAVKPAMEAFEVLAADPEARMIAERRRMGQLLYRADLAAAHEEGYAIGFAKGLGKALIKLLEKRGLAVSDAVRERIALCRDAEQLDVWLKRGASIERAEQLFDAP
jgi:hypothetical protein